MIRRSNDYPNISDLFSYGVGKDRINEGKNFAFDNCLAFLMEKLSNKQRFDYWIITGVTGNGYTPVYSLNDSAAPCEYSLSGYLAGPDYVSGVLDAMGYTPIYVSAAQLNKDKPAYIQRLKDHIGNGIPVIVIHRHHAENYPADALTHYLYVSREDHEKSFLFSKIADKTLYDELNATEFISQDWVFVSGKNRNIPLIDICRNAIEKLPHWLTLPQKDGVSYGASAFRAWADAVESGWYDCVTDIRHHYVVYICTLATIAWANNTIDAPYASIVNRLAQMDTQYADLNTHIAEQYRKLGDENGSTGFCKNGIWRDLEDLGGGFNCTCETLRNRNSRVKIAAKLREAAICIDTVVQALQAFHISSR